MSTNDELKPKWTKGEWRKGDNDKSGPWCIVADRINPGDEDVLVCTIGFHGDPEICADAKPWEEANASLICAAPDMAALLAELVEAYDAYNPDYWQTAKPLEDVCESARALLAKIGGA